MPRFEVEITCRVSYLVVIDAEDKDAAWEQGINADLEEVMELGSFQAMGSSIQEADVRREYGVKVE